MFLSTFVSIYLLSCQDEVEILNEESPSLSQSISGIQKDSLMKEFVKILSSVVYEREDVREFLKNEAIKKFDKNSDILYANIKHSSINGESFRDILINKSSEEVISNVETNIPLLNILIPTLPFFDVTPENMDCSDKEIPVAYVDTKDGVKLYIDGACEGEVAAGEVPDFHVFVVNENSRVKVEDNISRNGDSHIVFISPEYDGRRISRSDYVDSFISRSDTVPSSVLGSKAIESYSYFYKDDGSVNSKSYQRDYIYYGLTPTSQTGSLNRSVSEYLSFIKVNPKSYFKISDQQDGFVNDDPKIQTDQYTSKGTMHSLEEQITHFWTKGTYNFRIELYMSNLSKPLVKYLPLSPSDLWDFNIQHSAKKGNMFHRRKHTYKINVNDFTPKKVNLIDKDIAFGRWDLSEEALYRIVNVYEEDVATTRTYTETYELSKMTSLKIDGSVKFGLGTDKVSGNVGSGTSQSTTETIKKTYTIERNEQDDDLGNVRIYFYDPIIEGKYGSQYIVRTYNTGIVEFGIFVK